MQHYLNRYGDEEVMGFDELMQNKSDQIDELQMQSIFPQRSINLDLNLDFNLQDSNTKEQDSISFQKDDKEQKKSKINQNNDKRIQQKCQLYIQKLRQQLYLSEVQINKSEIEKTNTCINFSKDLNDKQDHKIQIKQKNKNQFSKKHLIRLWSNRLMYFLKLSANKHDIPTELFANVSSFITKNKINVLKLAHIFRQNPWIHQILMKEEDRFLEYIALSKIHVKSKIMMFETYTLLKEGMRDPQNFKTLAITKKKKLDDTSKISQKCRGKSYIEMCQILRKEYQISLQDNKKSSKCSPVNNITYHWNKYLKKIVESKPFQGKYSRIQCYRKLKVLIGNQSSIQNIKAMLEIKQLSQFILENKIYNNEIYSEIIGNNRINLQNKYNMMISVENLIRGLGNPANLRGWFQ